MTEEPMKPIGKFDCWHSDLPTLVRWHYNEVPPSAQHALLTSFNGLVSIGTPIRGDCLAWAPLPAAARPVTGVQAYAKAVPEDELTAMRAVFDILRRFDSTAQQRIASWACDQAALHAD